MRGHCVAALPADSPRSNARTSDSRNLRCPPGVRMLLMRPDAAHRVTVFGSTRKSAATSPGVRSRSLLPSTFHPSYLRFGACLQCRENIRLLPCFRDTEDMLRNGDRRGNVDGNNERL